MPVTDPQHPSTSNATDAASLFERARRAIPGGVNSPVRSFSSVGGTPRFISRAEGAYLIDSEGKRYVDLVASWGPLPFGHAHPQIVAAVEQSARAGTSFGAPTLGEIELAEEIIAAVPSIEQVRLVSSGTEAAMSTLRLARGATGRNKILKFAGHYHGHADALLVAAGSGVATLGIPGSPGVTPGCVADTIVVPWNDPEAVVDAVARHGDDLAAIVAEPVAANMNLVPPSQGFLDLLRQQADGCGALLVFDEVITGFRLARGGGQQVTGVLPDLTVLGKIVGGGLPLAAFGGRAEVMQQLAPAGDVYQAGTLSGNPVAVAAGLTQLRMLDQQAYGRLEAITDDLVQGLRGAFSASSQPVTVVHYGTLAGIVFAAEPPRDAAEVAAADHDAYARFFHAMLDQGVYLAPSGHEVLFTSLALAPDDVDRVVEAAGRAVRKVGGLSASRPD